MTVLNRSMEATASPAVCFSPSTPRHLPPRFCPKEAAELSQLVLEEHGGASLNLMHERSVLETGCVDSNLLACSSYAGIRRKAVDWLIKVFYNLNLRDEWMVGVVTLLDRVAARRGAAVSVNQKGAGKRIQSRVPQERDLTAEEQAECLAAMLCVLKLSSAEAELETIGLKELIFQIAELPSGSSTVWDLIVKSEFSMYRTLDYNVALPSSADLAGRIVLLAESAARKQHSSWLGLVTEEPLAPRRKLIAPVSRFSLLVSFLVELGLTHIQDAVHGQGTPAVALALVAVHLSLDRFGDVPSCVLAAVEAAKEETLGAKTACLLPLSLALHAQWATPASGSRVIRKWEHRAQLFTHGALPKPSEQLPVCSGLAKLPLQTREPTPPRATTPIRVQPKPKPSPRSAPKLAGPKVPMSVSESKLEAVAVAVTTPETAVPVVAISEEVSEDSEMLPAALLEKPVADKTIETLAKERICDKEVQPGNLAFLANISRETQLHSAQPKQQEVVPPNVAFLAQIWRETQLQSAMPAPLSVLVSRPSSAPSSPVKEDDPFVCPPLSNDSKASQPATKLVDSGARHPASSSTASSVVSRAANLLQRSPRPENGEVSSVSMKAQVKFGGAWEIHSVAKGVTIGKAVVAGDISYIKLRSTRGCRDPLRIEGTGEGGKPFLVIDKKHGTYQLWEHQLAGHGAMERLTWKHTSKDKYTMWVRTEQTQSVTKAPRTSKKAESVFEDRNTLAQAFNNVIAGPPAKKRKLVSTSSNESIVAVKVGNTEANKENVTQNRPLPQPQALVSVKGLPGDRSVLQTYGKRPRAAPTSLDEDEFVCY